MPRTQLTRHALTLLAAAAVLTACQTSSRADDVSDAAPDKPAPARTAPAKPAVATAAPAKPVAATASPAPADLLAGNFTTSPTGLKHRDLTVGTGTPVVAGVNARVHYTGWLTDGTKFDSSVDRGAPFTVSNVGRAGVIKGWNEGLVGMKVGGKRRLVIPASLAYGPAGRGKIPPDATLVFDIEVLDVQAAPPQIAIPDNLPVPAAMTFPDVAKLRLTTNASGLKWADLQAGTGTEVTAGSSALMHYTGWLENGTKFDSSVDRKQPFSVNGIPNAPVIKGWNEGLMGMKEGGTRVLVIPGSLAYGEKGFPGAIPPNATLIFQVQAMKVSK